MTTPNNAMTTAAAGSSSGMIPNNTTMDPTTTKTTTTKAPAKKKASKARPKKKVTKPSAAANALPSPMAQMKSMMEYQSSLQVVSDIQQRQHDLSLDPLWTLPSSSSISKSSSAQNATSQTIGYMTQEEEIVAACLQHVGLARDNCQQSNHVIREGAYKVLLERARRYALELVQDAHDLASGKIKPADLELAAQFLSEDDDEEDVVLEPTSINRIPLPLIPSNCYTGIALPDKHSQHTLLARTYDVVSAARISQQYPCLQQPHQPQPQNQHSNTANNTTSAATSSSVPSYGAARGRQIPIHFKSNATSNTPIINTNTTNPPTVTSTTTTMTTATLPTTTAPTKRKADELDLIVS